MPDEILRAARSGVLVTRSSHRVPFSNFIRQLFLLNQTQYGFKKPLAPIYSADLNYPDKRTKLEFSNAFFSNWVNIRQKVNRTKVASNFTRINMVPFLLRNSQQKFYPKNGSIWLFSINQELRGNYFVN